MKRFRYRLGLSSMVAFLVILLGVFGALSTAAAKGSQESSAAGTGTATATQPVPPGPLTKYDPPITITTVRVIDPTMTFGPGEDIDNNIWTKTVLDNLGVNIKNEWTVSGSQAYNQKLNVSIASGDLPEMFQVNATQLKQLYDAGLLADLTDVYKTYASPLLKKIVDSNGPPALGGATFGGKLYALPTANGSIDNSYLIWVRKDWLDKLNLPAPKTMADVLNIAEAFTKDDPDGNGKNDTYGLALEQTIIKQGFADATGLFNGYHAYPGIWIKDSSGNLVYGTIQPQVREALATLQKMYANGEIDPEFGVKDAGKEAELIAAGKIGMGYGMMWNPLYPLNQSLKNDPKANWQVYPIVSVDSQPAKTQVNNSVSGYFVVSKTSKHPEALVKLMNFWVEMGWGTTLTPDQYAALWKWFKEFEFRIFPATDNLDSHFELVKAIDSKDPSKLNSQNMTTYKHMIGYLNGSGDPTDWAYYAVFGKNGPFDIINNYLKNNMLVYDQFYGAPTPTMVSKGAILQKMEIEMLTKVIMGSPLTDFDKFVTNWKNLGGDQITKEVNDWYKSR